jgi:hypothetical protein
MTADKKMENICRSFKRGSMWQNDTETDEGTFTKGVENR